MSIPSGTTATIIIPDNYARVVNDGKMSDYIPTDEEIAASLANLPKID